ncbi:MAG: methyltransferase domain-containing protein [Comamonadaceae bacterium]|nr:methyltransferase domain-containing protein [Comamonadaceae bacterium]
MAPTVSPLHIYERQIDSRERTSLSVLAGHIPPNARVLDLGCGSGAVGRYLKEQHSGVTIDGLTISADEAKLASAHYRRVEVADLDTVKLGDVFDAASYDIIICADVLEHIRHPDRVLGECKQLLAPGGRALLSIPNVAYTGLIAELMAGEFLYRPEGLLDETHVHFFTRLSLQRFLAEQRWVAEHLETIDRELPNSEFRSSFDALPPSVARHLLALPDALTYQFIAIIRPLVAGEQLSTVSREIDSPVLPARAFFTAELFLGTESGESNKAFTQEGKISAAGVIGTPRQTLRFDLPAAQKAHTLRLDPADRPGFVHFHAMRLYAADGTRLWQWQGEDGALLASAPHQEMLFRPLGDVSSTVLALLHGNDPWVELPITAPVAAAAAGGHLEVDMGWPMSADYLALASAVTEFETRTQLAESRIARTREELQASHQLELTRLHRELGDQIEGERLEVAERHHQELSRLHQQFGAQHEQLAVNHAEELGRFRRALAVQSNDLRNHKLQLQEAIQHIQFLENSTVFRASRPLVRAKMKLDQLLGRGPVAADPSQVKLAQPVTPPDHPVDVIVPVYRGLADTQCCVLSVLRSECRTPWRLIVINDASPEPEVTAWLREIATTDSRIELLENETNLGFVGTVNRGMALSGTHDTLLLNSDAEVANDWLDRIRAAAYCDQKVASVTPFSNNATICSYPRFCADNELPEGWDTARLDALFARTSPGQVVDVPTGIGFCMYIRRDALQAIGLFDVENFGKGYGEENDFCIRASDAGWRNLHVLDTFVRHAGGVSFGAAKSPRERAAMETLRRLHPRYEGDVMRFLQVDPAQQARLAADIARIQDGHRPVILAILHDRQGGTERHVHELASALRERAQFLVLRPLPGHRVSIRLPDPEESFELVYTLPGEQAVLIDTLLRFGVQHVHFHHLLGNGEFVRTLPEQLGVSFDFTAHDYYTICPQISLTDRTNSYCGELGPEQCGKCLANSPAPEGMDIVTWRRAHAEFLSGARFLIAPARDALGRIAKLVPGTAARVVPHTDIDHTASLPAPQPARLEGSRPLRVAVIGALSTIKGADVLEDVAVAAAKQGASVEFHLIGYGYRALRTQPGARLTVHGKYEDKELPSLLQWLQPDLVWFPAQWPETYSYTLSACLQGGWPVVAPDLGAFSERLTGRAWSWVTAWQKTPAQWVSFFEDIRARHFATGQGPSAPVPNMESSAQHELLANASVGDSAKWYAAEYMQGLAAPSGQGPELQALLRQASSTSPVSEGSKGLLLSLLVRLRSTPVLSGVARAIPLRWQTRVKSWLKK